MNCINLAISVCSLLAAIASAVAAWKSATSAKTANTLAKEALTKHAQSELFLKVLLELARIHRLMTDFINNDNSDTDFSMVFDGQAAAELLPLLKELDALSPKFRASIKEDSSLADLLSRMSSKSYMAIQADLILLQDMIDLLQNSQREELSNP
ncbi:hypothetical protein [Aeromonas caviae]